MLFQTPVTVFDRPEIYYNIGGQSYFSSIQSNPAANYTAFSVMIHDRLQYLESLHNLGANWISGALSESPTPVSLNAAGDFLSGLNYFLQESRSIPLPDLLMAPIPLGGFGIQLNSEGLSIDVSFYNNKEIAFEYSENDSYCEIPCNSVSDCLFAVKDLYRDHFRYV